MRSPHLWQGRWQFAGEAMGIQFQPSASGSDGQVLCNTGLRCEDLRRLQSAAGGVDEAVESAIAEGIPIFAPGGGDFGHGDEGCESEGVVVERTFSAREFHGQVVGGGSLPLPVLDAKIERWLAARQ